MAEHDNLSKRSEAAGATLEPLLSISELRQVLPISESGVYRLMRSGELPAVRIGGRTLFSPDAVRQLIASRTGTAAEDARTGGES